MTRITTMLAAAGAALALAPCVAQGQAPAPTCGNQFTDKAGDTASGADNLDITAGYLSYADDGSVSANLVVKNLSKDYPGSSNGIRWRFTFTVNGKSYYVGAFRDVVFEPLADPYYDWGTFDGGTESFVGIADGVMYEGENGVLSVKIPGEVGVEDGMVITEINAFTESYTTLAVTEIETAEDGPDSAGSTFTVGPCIVDLPIALGTQRLSAKKASKSRKATIFLSSTGLVTDLVATLESGSGKVVGRGRLAKLDGAGKLRLKLRKKLKKGDYTLGLEGTGSDGLKRTIELKVEFK